MIRHGLSQAKYLLAAYVAFENHCLKLCTTDVAVEYELRHFTFIENENKTAFIATQRSEN